MLSNKEKQTSKEFDKKSYDAGWRQGKAKGRREGISECHAALKAKKPLPAVPADRTMSPEKIKAKRQKLTAQLEKLNKVEKQQVSA